MKESIYSWMKNLAVFYIFLTAVMNFIPDKKYEKYLQHFMGLLLILMIVSPVFQAFQMKETLTGNFWDNYREEEIDGLRRKGEQIQEGYLKEEYEKELEKSVQNRLEGMGIELLEVQVQLEETQDIRVKEIQITQKEPLKEGEEEIIHVLEEDYGIEENKIQFQSPENNETAVAHSPSGGTYSGNHCASGN